MCSCYYQIFAQKTKNQNYKDWKKFNSINILSRDITFISDSILDGYNNLIFAHKKPFAIWVKDGENVGIWSRDSLYRRDSLWKFKDIQDIRISPDDKMLAIITYDSSNIGFLVHILDLQNYTLLHKAKINSFLDLIFTTDNKHYFILLAKNKIEMRNSLDGNLEQNFVIPGYDESHVYYTNIKRILISKTRPNQLLLLDIGPAEELSLIKKGIHINLYLFDYNKRQFDEPVNLYFNGDPHESPPSKFTALEVSEDGKYIFIGVKRKIITYNLDKKNIKTNQLVGESSYLRCDPDSRYLIVGNESSASLWEITPDDPVHILRLLRQLLTKTKDLYFYDHGKYLVGNVIQGNRISFFNAVPLLSIREQPGIFVQYAAQKHTKIDLEQWFKKVNKKSRKRNISLNLNNSENESYIKDLFNRNFQYYARELFNIASNYLYTPDLKTKISNLLYIYTYGFAPIEIKTTEQDFKHKQEAFLKGWYKWEKMEFGCSSEQLYIKKAQILINSYPYNYDESKNILNLPNKLSVTFQNFDLKSERLN